MDKSELLQFLIDKPGYQKAALDRLSKLSGLDIDTIKIVLQEARTITSANNEDELYKEFLEWKKSSSTKRLSSTRNNLPIPYVGNPNNILVIGDLHEPFCLDSYLYDCRRQQELFNCGTVIFIGDIIDNHYTSYHETELNALSADDEFEITKLRIQDWYRVFPEAYVTVGNHDRLILRKAKSGGISTKWIKSFPEALGVPNWKFVESIEFFNINFVHGENGSAFKRAKDEQKSQVQGHIHSEGYIQWCNSIFGMQVGCGCNNDQYAFAYAKGGKSSFIGCGVILDKGKLPILIKL